jgi:hypothetical protein
MPHEAATSGSHSLHLTIGIRVRTWADLMNAVMAISAPLHGYLPLGALGSAEAIATELAGLVQDFISEQEVQAGLEGMAGTELAERFTLGPGAVDQVDRAFQIDHSTGLRKRHGRQCRFSIDRESVFLDIPGHRMRLPLAAALSLKFMVEVDSFKVADMPWPSQPREQIELARQLIFEGFLEVSELEAANEDTFEP